ncbi:MAG: AMP-binding protein [Mycobacterium sp.]|nr:AMP-binding protein [Mycobacterium sp.]
MPEPETAGGTVGFVPFPPGRAARYRDEGLWTGRPLDTLLRNTTVAAPQRTAVVDPHGRLSYAELDAAADAAAAGLTRLGIRPGDRVLLQLPNRNSFAVALFGLLRAGAWPVMCLPGHREAELGHFIEVAGATALIVADVHGGFDYREMAAGLSDRHPGLRHVVVDGDPGGFTPWSAVVATPFGPTAPVAVDTSGPAVLLVSGGTTNVPKLIPRTHDDYRYNAVAAAQACGLTADDVYLAVLPAGHNFPLACPGLLGAIAVGATTVFATDPSPESAFAVINTHRVSATALVPSLATLWAQATEWEPAVPDSLRLLQVGGAKLAAADARRIRECLTEGVQQVFGMAEGLLCLTRPGDPADIVEGTQGRPLSASDEIRILGSDGTPVPPGEPGELVARGPYTINGYYRAEAANRSSFDADGFYRSGDEVQLRPDGYLEVTGRIKDVILRAGESLSAAELETHLRSHPAVRSIAAVGLADAFLGELVCAAGTFDGDPPSVAELNEHLRARGAATQLRVDRVAAVTALPLTSVGKVDKRALATALA